MKKIFKIIVKGNPMQMEMSREVLDLAIKISSYINDNFMESDFFTICNTRQEVLAEFLGTLQEAQTTMTSKDTTILLSLDNEEYRIFDYAFWYGRNFGDDIEELEAVHDDIWDISEIIDPR